MTSPFRLVQAAVNLGVGAALLWFATPLIAWRGCPLCWLTGLFSTPRR